MDDGDVSCAVSRVYTYIYIYIYTGEKDAGYTEQRTS